MGLDDTSNFKWLGFVTDIDRHSNTLAVVTEKCSLECQSIKVCNPKLFGLSSNVLFRPEQQDEYLSCLMRKFVKGNSTKEAYLLAELI